MEGIKTGSRRLIAAFMALLVTLGICGLMTVPSVAHASDGTKLMATSSSADYTVTVYQNAQAFAKAHPNVAGAIANEFELKDVTNATDNEKWASANKWGPVFVVSFNTELPVGQSVTVTIEQGRNCYAKVIEGPVAPTDLTFWTLGNGGANLDFFSSDGGDTWVENKGNDNESEWDGQEQSYPKGDDPIASGANLTIQQSAPSDDKPTTNTMKEQQYATSTRVDVPEAGSDNWPVAGTPLTTLYAVSVAPTAHGSVIVSPTQAEAGVQITITTTPAKGYALVGLSVNADNGTSVSLKSTATGYSFTMPAANVVVAASFSNDYGYTPKPQAPSQNKPSAPSTVLGYADVSANAWYAGVIEDATAHGLMVGWTNANGQKVFGPEAPMTRAQAATILWRYAEPDEAAAYDMTNAENTTPWADCEDDQFYTGAMNWAYENKVFSGYEGSDLTGPNDTITREQMCAILYNLATTKYEVSPEGNDPSSYADATNKESVSPWAEDVVGWAYHNQIMTGFEPNNDLAAGNVADRAQGAKMFVFTLGKLIGWDK